MNNELLAFEHAYDDLKAKYDALRESHMKLEQNLKEMTAENAMMKDEWSLYKEAYSGLKNMHDELEDELEKTKEKLKDMIGQRDRLYGAYNDVLEKLKEMDSKYRKLSAENQMLKDDNYILKLNADKVPQSELTKLESVLSEAPLVINTKSINITFDNHTNNFKEDAE